MDVILNTTTATVIVENSDSVASIALAAQAAAQAAETGAETAQTAAQAAQVAAEAAETGAETAQVASETARDASILARDKAEEWADNPEDVPVEIGKFSALHWAAKSEDQTTIATAQANAAASSATDAETAQAASEAAQDLSIAAKNTAETAATNAAAQVVLCEAQVALAQQAVTDATDQVALAAAQVALAEAQVALAVAARIAAETAATNAETAETNAGASATAAASSASAAATSATEAEAAKTAVEGILDFTDGNVYQGDGVGIEALSREDFGRQRQLFFNSPLTGINIDPFSTRFYDSFQRPNAQMLTADSGQLYVQLEGVNDIYDSGVGNSANFLQGTGILGISTSQILITDQNKASHTIRFRVYAASNLVKVGIYYYKDSDNWFFFGVDGGEGTSIIKKIAGVETEVYRNAGANLSRAPQDIEVVYARQFSVVSFINRTRNLFVDNILLTEISPTSSNGGHFYNDVPYIGFGTNGWSIINVAVQQGINK